MLSMASRILRLTVAALLLGPWVSAMASARATPYIGTPGVIRSTAAFDRTVKGYLGDAGGTSSALVVDETTGQTLLSVDPRTARLPASVEKLFTTSAALFEFGSEGRFRTSVYGLGSVSHGVFSGKLYLKGGGDPTFGDARFNARLYGTGASVQALAASLHADGIDEIKGSIVGDASIFDRDGGGPDSGYRANPETEGELSGLSYDAGWTSSAETRLQPHPALWATQAFASVAPSQGIKVTKGTKLMTGTTPASAKLLAYVSSPTMSTLLDLTNAPSDNFFAETLDKDLGAYWGGGGSTEWGASVVQRVVAAKLGLPERTNDGSGLSRFDRTTAQTVVELLEEMQPSLAFYDSLAVAGVSGTMVDEMLGSPAAGNCRGKTGTLKDVANLVGYCLAANGDRLAFAFLENGLGDSTYGHETEDEMGEALANYDGNGQGASPAPALPQPDAGAGVPENSTPTSGSGSASSTTTTASTTTTTTPPSGGGVGL
jgi:D-alanyl-D-alanine carboxypeptidase/D-alanyl-D-alanine-endopeptidase (penicillin-binding protein 4)